jgi:O-antigen ligase
MVLRPKNIAPWRLGTMIVVSLFLLWASDLKVPVPGGKDREVSFEQIVDNLLSITGQSQHVGLEGTKEWRLLWWTDIVNYTVHGKYFWTGKGFGVNLADDDGYQVGDGTLRSPHNVHMTILARTGVPGILIWATLHLFVGASLFLNYLRARMSGDERWTKLFMFIFAFWLAFLINGSFDVFIEGPMGGIWFWTVVGTGMASIWIYKNYPEALDEVPA